MNNHVIQYFDGKRPLYQQCMDQVKSAIPSGITHELIKETTLTARYQDYRAVSDLVRLTYLATDPNTVWLDSDVLIKKWPDFKMKKNRPYISRFNDGAVIFCNGCTELFKSMLELYNLDETIAYPGWFQELLVEHKSKIELLPEGYFVHVALSQVFLAETARFTNYSTADYKVYRDETGELKLDVRF